MAKGRQKGSVVVLVNSRVFKRSDKSEVGRVADITKSKVSGTSYVLDTGLTIPADKSGEYIFGTAAMIREFIPVAAPKAKGKK